MSRYRLSLTLFGLPCRQGNIENLSGLWSLCLSDSFADSVCGTVDVGPAQEVVGPKRPKTRAIHSLPS